MTDLDASAAARGLSASQSLGVGPNHLSVVARAHSKAAIVVIEETDIIVPGLGGGIHASVPHAQVLSSAVPLSAGGVLEGAASAGEVVGPALG